jgi:hypothetical protein
MSVRYYIRIEAGVELPQILETLAISLLPYGVFVLCRRCIKDTVTRTRYVTLGHPVVIVFYLLLLAGLCVDAYIMLTAPSRFLAPASMPCVISAPLWAIALYVLSVCARIGSHDTEVNRNAQ